MLKKLTAEENERSRYVLLNEDGGMKRIGRIRETLDQVEKELENPGNNDAFYGRVDCFLNELEELIRNYEETSAKSKR